MINKLITCSKETEIKNYLDQDLSSLIFPKLKHFLAEIYQDKLDKIILFGSRARGDNRPDSDFDILIVLKDNFNYSQEIEKTSKFIAELPLKFDLVISRVFATKDEFIAKNTPFFLNVRRGSMIS